MKVWKEKQTLELYIALKKVAYAARKREKDNERERKREKERGEREWRRELTCIIYLSVL